MGADSQHRLENNGAELHDLTGAAFGGIAAAAIGLVTKDYAGPALFIGKSTATSHAALPGSQTVSARR